MTKRNTIKEVAEEAGVDVSTVSRCLNGLGRVNPKTKARIVAAAERLNYSPSRIAQGLLTGKSQTIGLIISDIRNPFFAEVARGVEDAAYRAGYDVVLCNSDLRPEKQIAYIRSLVKKSIDGIVINWAAGMNAEKERDLLAYGVPIVLLNGQSSTINLSSVSVENHQGGFLAGSFLMRLGHRNVALLAGPEDQLRVVERKSGFLKGLESAQRPFHSIALHGDQSFEGGYQMTWKLLSHHPEITAIFTHNDVMAFGAYRALAEAGRRVPDDVSVIGFDNVEVSGMMQPPLTTIDQPKYEVGQAAVELLLGLVKEENPEPKQRIFGVRLIERQSTRQRAEN